MNARVAVLSSGLDIVSAFPSDSGLRALEVGCMFKRDEGLSTLTIGERISRASGGTFISIEYDQTHIDAAVEIIRETAPDLLSKIRFFLGNSLVRLPEALQELQQVDFAFLDGGAHPEVCLQEFEMVLRHLSPRGLIVVDDVQELPPTQHFPLKRPFGKGTLIYPVLAIADYLKGRPGHRGVNPPAASDLLELLPCESILGHLGAIDYTHISHGKHGMLAIGGRKVIEALHQAVGALKDAKLYCSPLGTHIDRASTGIA